VTLRAGDTECRGDLVARAQRGPLSAADRSALIAHLSSCESCRLIRQVASDFAEMRAVDRGDELRLEEMAALARRAVRGGARPGRPRWYARAAAAAAGLLLIAGSASATAWLWPRLVARAPAPPAPTRVPAVEPPHRVPARAPAASTSAAPPPAEAPPAAPAPVVAMSAPARSRSARERPAIRTTAGDLLRQARDAKTDGHSPQAIALYRRLQKEFPASSEALVAAVPLGRLLLDGPSPREALAEFDRYLGGAAGGALVPEALYGRAQAQARLGDRDAERASWRRLLAGYPDSPYSALARRRLTELQ